MRFAFHMGSSPILQHFLHFHVLCSRSPCLREMSKWLVRAKSGCVSVHRSVDKSECDSPCICALRRRHSAVKSGRTCVCAPLNLAARRQALRKRVAPSLMRVPRIRDKPIPSARAQHRPSPFHLPTSATLSHRRTNRPRTLIPSPHTKARRNRSLRFRRASCISRLFVPVL